MTPFACRGCGSTDDYCTMTCPIGNHGITDSFPIPFPGSIPTTPVPPHRPIAIRTTPTTPTHPRLTINGTRVAYERNVGHLVIRTLREHGGQQTIHRAGGGFMDYPTPQQAQAALDAAQVVA